MPRQTAPPHRGGIHAREIRILELTQPPSRRAVRKSFKHFKSRLHPSTTWLKNESTSCSETSRRFGPAALPFLSATPRAVTEKRYRPRESRESSGRLVQFIRNHPPLRSQPREKLSNREQVFETWDAVPGWKATSSMPRQLVFHPRDTLRTRANTRSDFIDWPCSASGAVKRARLSGTSDATFSRCRRYRRRYREIASERAGARVAGAVDDEDRDASRRGGCRAAYCQNLRRAIPRNGRGCWGIRACVMTLSSRCRRRRHRRRRRRQGDNRTPPMSIAGAEADNLNESNDATYVVRNSLAGRSRYPLSFLRTTAIKMTDNYGEIVPGSTC